MSHSVPDAANRLSAPDVMSPAEKLACEWEARHDVAARGRQADPAAALHRYLSHTRIEEDRRHQDPPSHSADGGAVRPAHDHDEFAARHPLAASWFRWGEDPRRPPDPR
jgi:hypothetical protein